MNWGTLIPRPGFLAPFAGSSRLSSTPVAITGARGTLGRILVRRLADAGVATSTYDGNILDQDRVADWIALANPGVVIHLAAMVPTSTVNAAPAKAMRVNAVGSLGLLEAVAAQSNPAWLFHASSSHVYAPTCIGAEPPAPLSEEDPLAPVTFYGATKLAAENLISPLAQALSVPLCMGRIFSFFHETQPESYLIPGLFARARDLGNARTAEIRSGHSVRDFLHAEWVVDAILALAARRTTGTLNVGSGIGRSVREMARLVFAASGHPATEFSVQPGPKDALVADTRRLEQALRSACG